MLHRMRPRLQIPRSSHGSRTDICSLLKIIAFRKLRQTLFKISWLETLVKATALGLERDLAPIPR